MTPTPELPSTTRFALMLETACNDFEALAKLVRNELRMVAKDQMSEVRAAATIQMALAKSFVFHVVRSRRICTHEAANLKIAREDRRRFLANTDTVLQVRDVNEHGFDPPAAGKVSKPSMHFHSDVDAALDETSLVILGDQKILMGPLNLYAVYLPVSRMRQLAGFQSLPRESE
jgi:hypothetical protein